MRRRPNDSRSRSALTSRLTGIRDADNDGQPRRGSLATSFSKCLPIISRGITSRFGLVAAIWQDVDLTGNSRERRLSALTIRLPGLQRSCGRLKVGSDLVASHTATAEQVSRIVEPGAQFAVGRFFLEKLVFNLAIVGLEVGNLPAKLLVLEFELTEPGFEGSDVRSPRE